MTERPLVFFDKLDFSAVDFNVTNYVSNRLHVPCELLMKELSGHLREIRAHLIDLVNSEYSHFVSLTKNLIGVDVMIAELKTPVSHLRERIADVSSVFERMVAQLETQFEYRSSLRQRKTWLQLYKDIGISLEKLESLLGIELQSHSRRASLGKEEQKNLALLTSMGDVHVEKLVERISIEYNQLHFLLSRVGSVPFVDAVRPRIARVRESMHSLLSISFGRALEDAANDALSSSLRTAKLEAVLRYFRSYTVMDQAADAVLVFQMVLIKPFVDELLSSSNISKIKTYSQRRASGASVENSTPDEITLSFIYNCFVDFVISKKLWPIVCQMRSAIKANSDLDPIIDVALPLFVAKLTPVIQPLFLPTSPDAFHEAYSETVDFLLRMESETLPSQTSTTRFRNSQAYTELLRRWQTSLYWHIRFNEIASQFEDVLDTPLDEMTQTLSKTGHGLLLPSTQQLIVCIRLCWSDKVHLHVLSGRLWRLTLLLVSRYRQWIRAIVKDVPSTDTQDTSKAAKVLLLAGAVLLNDCTVLPSKLESSFTQFIVPKLPKSAQSSFNLLLGALLEISTKIAEGDMKPLKDYMLRHLAQECSLSFKGVRDIPGLYRRTNREPPKSASSFIPTCLKPLEVFCQQHESLLQEAFSKHWVAEVVNAVGETYYELLEDMLTTVQKTEDSLKRLLKAKRPTFTSASTPVTASRTEETISDEDKIRLQCYIDVKEFLALAGEFKVERSNSAILEKLSQLVDSFERLGSATAGI